MEKEICTCSCHQNSLLFHIHKCCEHSGKIYIDEYGKIDLEKYTEIISKKTELTDCPCCGGTGKVRKNS